MGIDPLPSVDHWESRQSDHLQGHPESKHIQPRFARYADWTTHSRAQEVNNPCRYQAGTQLRNHVDRVAAFGKDRRRVKRHPDGWPWRAHGTGGVSDRYPGTLGSRSDGVDGVVPARSVRFLGGVGWRTGGVRTGGAQRARVVYGARQLQRDGHPPKFTGEFACCARRFDGSVCMRGINEVFAWNPRINTSDHQFITRERGPEIAPCANAKITRTHGWMRGAQLHTRNAVRCHPAEGCGGIAKRSNGDTKRNLHTSIHVYRVVERGDEDQTRHMAWAPRTLHPRSAH